MEKKTSKMADVDEILATLREMISDSMYEGIETTADADFLQKTALEMVEEVLSAYKDLEGGK